MKSKDFCYAIGAIAFLSCSLPMLNAKWNVIRGIGIKGENLTFGSLLLKDGRQGLLIGNECSDEDIIHKRIANFDLIAFSSADGGIHWTKKVMGKGKLTNSISYGDKILAVAAVKSSVDQDTVQNTSAAIYFSPNFGTTWTKLSSLDNFYVRDIYFTSSEDALIVGKSSGANHWSILASTNHGATWNSIAPLSNDMYSPIYENERLYCLIRNKPNIILRLQISRGIVDTILVGDKFAKTGLLTTANGKVYLAATIGRSLRVYKLDDLGNKFDPIADLNEDKFPVNIYSFAGNLVLLLGERNSVGVTYSVYFKSKSDTLWHNEQVPTSLFNPHTFSQGSIWGYSYDGNFYVLNLAD